MSWHIESDLDHRMELGGNLVSLIKDPDQDIFQFENGNDKGRLQVFTTSNYFPTLIERDHSICLARGYMMTPADWRNFEATAYVYISSNTNDSFWIRGRGGKHVSSGSDCEGFSYTGVIFFNGSVTIGKEQFHENILYLDPIDVTGSILDTWIGIKFVVYDDKANKDNDKYNVPVVLEIWLDTTLTNNWQPVFQYRDMKGWGSSAFFCNAENEDQKGLWGGPIVEFGWDNCQDIKLRAVSVREIDPFINFAEGGALLIESIKTGSSGKSGVVKSDSHSLVREVGDLLSEGTGSSVI
jgi:hypothetical protein